MSETNTSNSQHGLWYGVAAYGLWGLIPFYFRSLGNVPPIEVLAHRVVWSLTFLVLLITFSRRWPSLLRAVRSRQVLMRLAASAVLIGINWFTYIYAVMTHQVLAASLGYFITPLVNVLLGVIFLGERLRPLQLLGVVLAALGVMNLAVVGAGIPWIALMLTVSFAFYGLLRKTTRIDSTQGLFVETFLLAGPALIVLAWLASSGAAVALYDPAGVLPLLMAGGIVMTIPLLCFVAAARRLRMSTLGFLQFLSPSLQFLVAVLAFEEPFSQVQLTSFGCIWLAIALYMADSLLFFRQSRTARFEPVTVPE